MKVTEQGKRAALCAVLLAVLPAAHAQEEFSLGGHKLSEFPAAGAPPIFRLASAGAEPRRELRYRFAPGSLHQFVMTMRMSVGVEVDGRDAPVQRAPAMRMILDCRVTEAGERQARLEFRSAGPAELFETEGVAPAMLEAVRKGIGPLAGMRGEVSLSSRGVVRSSRLEFGQPLDQQMAQMAQSMQQSMEQSSVPLPEPAVGVGAEWKVLQRVQGMGISVYQVASFRIERLEGMTATLAVSVQQSAPRQPMPGGPGATSAELVSLQTRGEGPSIVDLRSPVPRSSVEMDQTMRMSVQTPERAVRVGMRTRMQVQVEPGAAR